MAKLTVAELKKRGAANRSVAPGPRIIIGLGTCGVAAGAQETLTVFTEELKKAGMEHVEVCQTGCMGLCHSEPTVEVVVPGMPTVVYGNVDAETARKIVNQHLGRKLLVNDHIHDKPAADIIQS